MNSDGDGRSGDLLTRALEKTCDVLRAGIADAERELEACRARCDELEAMISRARRFLGEVGDPSVAIPPVHGRLYLHEAMLKVLQDAPQNEMRAYLIAREINRRRLYVQRQGRPVLNQDIHGRVYRYPQLFERSAGGIRARG